jgi:hypothetical protein
VNEVKGRKIIKALLLLSLLLCAAAPLLAQGGGKAEPLRMEFKRGARSATVKGKVRHDEQAEYIFAARKGQRIMINLITTPAHSACFGLLGGDGEDLKFEHKCDALSDVAPETRDYLIYVTKHNKNTDSSSYSLTLRIK